MRRGLEVWGGGRVVFPRVRSVALDSGAQSVGGVLQRGGVGGPGLEVVGQEAGRVLAGGARARALLALPGRGNHDRVVDMISSSWYFYFAELVNFDIEMVGKVECSEMRTSLSRFLLCYWPLHSQCWASEVTSKRDLSSSTRRQSGALVSSRQ
jgi:hypothetical protein